MAGDALAPDEVVRGIKSIAHALGCSRGTVFRLLRRASDPLRLWSAEHDPTPWQLRSRLLAFRRRWKSPADPELERTRVAGWLAVARLLRVSVDLAQRLAARAEDPLPIERTRAGRVYAHREALLDWLDGQNRPHALRAARNSGERSGESEGEGIQKPRTHPRQRDKQHVCQALVKGAKVRPCKAA